MSYLDSVQTKTPFKSNQSCPSGNICFGTFKPSKGTFKILLVYIRFEDDNQSMSYWNSYPNPNDVWDVENWMANSIDEDVTVQSDNYMNLTHYFREMSGGEYNVIGDVAYVEAPSKLNFTKKVEIDGDSVDVQLENLELMGAVNKWVIKKLDSEIDLSEYDNYKYHGHGNHEEVSDDYIDMIYMMYRTPSGKYFYLNETEGRTFGGIAQLSVRDTLSNGHTTPTVTLSSGLKVHGTRSGNGSGLTIHMENDRRKRFDDSYIHELAHYLIGPGIHPYTSTTPSAYWGIFAGTHGTNSVNAYEKELLGWIDENDITEIQMGQSYLLSDFVEHKQVLKYEIAPCEYYYFENHQRTQSTTGLGNSYDIPNLNENDKGIFILHVEEPYLGNNSLSSIVSDGTWDWTLDEDKSWIEDVCNPSGEPAFEKNHPNPFGKSFKDPIMSVTNPGGGGSYMQRLFIKASEPETCTKYFFGNDPADKSGYSINGTSLVSPYTNPTFLQRDGTPLNITMKITSEFLGLVALQFNSNDNPYTITENTTWDGQIFLDQNTKVENNATLTILPGTTVYMAENVQLDIRAGQGGTLISEGTEEEPIRFIRTDPNNAWKTIYLNSSAGSSIKWSLFDGGRTNLTIASQNNVIENSTFRNATFRNIDSWYNNDGSGNSSATLSHVLIEDGATVGLVAQYIDLDISNTTIQDNGQAGILVTSASVYPFHRNKVTNNGGSYHDGVAVTSSGTFYMHDDNLEDGYNEVFGNAGDEVSGSGDIAVGFTYPVSDGGYNSVHGDFSGGFYLVNNTSSTTVMAERVWWGQSFPQSSMFNGPVQFDMLFLYSDPTTGENSGTGGQTPAKALPGKEGEVLPLAEAYDQLERELEKAETEQQIRDGLHRLYQVAWLAKEKSPKLTGRFRQLARQSATGSNRIFELTSHNNTLQHAATLLYAKSYLRDGDYETADRWLRETDDLSLEGNDRRDWLHLEMDLHRYNGNVDAALETLKELYAHEESRGVDIESVKLSYQPIEEDIVRRMGGDGSVDPDRAKQNDDLSSTEALTLQNYPNPFNPTTQITFTLPEQSDVALVVYDMLGREVARLVDEVLPAGEQTVRFDASHLANGVYIYRLNANQQERVRMMTLIK